MNTLHRMLLAYRLWTDRAMGYTWASAWRTTGRMTRSL